MIRALITAMVCAASLSALTGAQDSELIQDDAPAALRIGHPDLDAGCHGESNLTDAGWVTYVRQVSLRMGREVLVCGASFEQAADQLAQGTLDLALTSAEAAAERAEAGQLRPLFRVRGLNEPLRREVLILASETAQPVTGLDDYRLVAFSAVEMQMISAVIRQRALEDEALGALSHQDAERMLEGRDWLPGQPTLDPIEALTGLADGSQHARVVLTQGRYSMACDLEPARCGSRVLEWRGFPATEQAFAVSSQLSTEDVYRLLGLHLLLAAADTQTTQVLTGRSQVEFEPTEATAFRYQPSR